MNGFGGNAAITIISLRSWIFVLGCRCNLDCAVKQDKMCQMMCWVGLPKVAVLGLGVRVKKNKNTIYSIERTKAIKKTDLQS